MKVKEYRCTITAREIWSLTPTECDMDPYLHQNDDEVEVIIRRIEDGGS